MAQIGTARRAEAISTSGNGGTDFPASRCPLMSIGPMGASAANSARGRTTTLGFRPSPLRDREAWRFVAGLAVGQQPRPFGPRRRPGGRRIFRLRRSRLTRSLRARVHRDAASLSAKSLAHRLRLIARRCAQWINGVRHAVLTRPASPFFAPEAGNRDPCPPSWNRCHDKTTFEDFVRSLPPGA